MADTMQGSEIDGWTRRGLLGASAALAGAAALPGSAQAAPERLTSIGLTFAYEAIVTLGKTEEVGATPLGKRIRIPITGGRFSGPRISGTISRHCPASRSATSSQSRAFRVSPCRHRIAGRSAGPA